MNRLVIIGNGFDLAHDLPTSYRSFINFVWQNYHNLDKMPKIRKLFKASSLFYDAYTGFPIQFEDYNHFVSKLKITYSGGGIFLFSNSDQGDKTFKVHKVDTSRSAEPVLYFDFENKFFELITVQNAENWVDIENTYYEVLISLLKLEETYKYIGTVKRLNEEFEEIKSLLEYYLTENIEKGYQFNLEYSSAVEICDLFEQTHQSLGQHNSHKYFLEFPPAYRSNLMEFDRGLKSQSRDQSLFENLFLDFNYTPTVSNYVRILNDKDSRFYGTSSHIQIHGKLHDIKNEMNFGFGDEMDDNYSLLEKANDNRYLENIKSFMYLSNSNYKKLLQWIESGDFQVFIMGHSCGLSDRTMLNTVFEHNNCKSIKIFFHEKEDETDNFKGLSQNISRHFNKKTLMRSKVVDKSLSKPLPQNVRFNII